MKRRIARYAALCALAAPTVAAREGKTAAGPSFDCAKASGQVEQLVCGDAALSALDRRMAEVYAAATKAWPENVAAEQRVYQRGWIKGRNECWKETDIRACTELSYKTRIVEIQIRSGQLMAPTPVGYTCAGSEKPFLATFHADTDPWSAVLTFGDDQVIAFAAPSGSGARYAAANVQFWEHQGEASLEWFGARLDCRVRAGEPAKAAPQEPRPPLSGTSWVLVEFQSMDDTKLRPEAGVRYALAFGDDGSLQVQSDCNRGRGSWRSPDNVTLELGPVALTRARCPPPSPLQDRFVRDLGFVRSYVVRDGKLHLSLMADGGIYSFEPEGAK